jgi:FAD/FMN-containing dehydrogenase
MTAIAPIQAERLQAIATTFSGVLLRPGDDGYEEARRVHNGLIDKRPALIARCRGTADIAEALRFAQESGLEVSIRGGGHNVAGRAVTDGGVMIDLSLMKAIYVDPVARKARAQGGVTWREFDRETAVHGLATTGGQVSTTGIAGLTLGGGIGWLAGKYGLAADNLISVELVTADGEVVTASEQEHPDLFWALRGGGGNFGVAASLEYRLHPLREVTGGLVAYPFTAAREVLRFFRTFVESASDELGVAAGLVHAPDGSGAKLAAIVVCHAGSPARATADLKPLLDFGSPALAQVGPMPYPVVNTLLDGGYPTGALNYWKSSFLRSFDDGAIDAMVERFAACPSPMSAIVIEFFHGAMTRVGVSDTAIPHRAAGYNFVITGVWTGRGATEENIAWTRETFAALQPYSADARWLNYLDRDDEDDATRAAYGPNYARLTEIKRKYDPNNVFRLNANIPPSRR